MLVAGPCVIESEDHLLRVGEAIRTVCEAHRVPFVLKSSFDKANRSSGRAFRGPGLQEGLRILERVRAKLDVPVLSDVHDVHQVAAAADVLDILQIPAFLCRQTDLLTAAARSGKPVNVKKGQFLSPWDAANIVEKLQSAGSEAIVLTERGSSSVTTTWSWTSVRSRSCAASAIRSCLMSPTACNCQAAWAMPREDSRT